jgi:hypothetical protein
MNLKEAALKEPVGAELARRLRLAGVTVARLTRIGPDEK